MNDRDLARVLAEPFPAEVVEWKAQAVRDNRALAVAYIDARAVMGRLDAAVGPGGWQTAYVLHPGGSVECRLSIYLGSEWVSKADVGSPSEQPDAGDQLKAAYSDALKRAAVQWGVGRYLYSLPAVWCDYDPKTRRLVGTPALPAWALPAATEAKAAPARPEPDRTHADMLRELHRRLQAHGRTWEKALIHTGVGLPDQFSEPQSEAEAVEMMARYASAVVCQTLLDIPSLTPVVKPKRVRA